MSFFNRDEIDLFVKNFLRSEKEANAFYNGERIISNEIQFCGFNHGEGDFTIRIEKFYLKSNFEKKKEDAIIFKVENDEENNRTNEVFNIEVVNKSITKQIVDRELNTSILNERQKQADTNVKFKKIKSYEIPSEEQNKIIQQTISKENYHRDIVRRKKYTKKRTTQKDIEIKYRKGRLNAKPR